MRWCFADLSLLRSTQIVMLRTVLTGSCKIQYRLLPLGSHSLQERTCQPQQQPCWPVPDVPQCPPNFHPQAAGWVLGHPCQTDRRLLGGGGPSQRYRRWQMFSVFLAKQWQFNWKEKTATWAAKRALEHLGRWPDGPAELLSVHIALGRRQGGRVKSIFPIDQKTPKHRPAHFYSY